MGGHEAAQIGVELCNALAAVHRAGFVHRDIKASNVMREEGGRILLMDFGAGRPQPKPDHQSLGLAGTPHYLAPELFAGGSPSPASDIYSLGVLVYHLVTGRYPIDAASFEAIELAHRRHDIRPLRDARPDLPSSFVNVIERALSPATGERYQTSGAFGNALAASVGAPPSKPEEKFPRPSFEWWKPAGALAVVCFSWDCGPPESVGLPTADRFRRLRSRSRVLRGSRYRTSAAWERQRRCTR